ncbi:MAG: hypothetical protein ISN29_04400 [Gammaproteobacteria bacterium AqS3]|nr:hypothetical protein [Gammaproteobacteria bacterium AqS3]
MSERYRALLVLNGLGLILTSIVIGWFYMFFLLGAIDLWPFVTDVAVEIGGDRRAWNMAHLEAITNGLLLMGLAALAPYIRLDELWQRVLFWSWIVFAWLFTLPATANALFGTRGLEFGGGPFPGDVTINNIIFMTGWPAMIGVHVGVPLALWGAWRHYRHIGGDS